MGPLVPDLITNELNLVVALLVGIAFGFILEQAGFSSSRKLTGLFYGTDFTVLRVFFTAGATAMTGVVLLAAAGLLDTRVIYVNPTFLYSALVGGTIMGVGFVVGGYCPGTSFCGAAVGRVDAMVFVLGGLVGVFGFAEAFPYVQRLYLSAPFGDPTVPAVLGISPGLFALLMSGVAIVAFALTTKLERRVNPASSSWEFSPRAHRLAAGALLLAAFVALVVPDYQTRMLARAGEQARTGAVAAITADELAFRILDNDPALVLIDVRPAAEFARSGLPGAANLQAADLFGADAREMLSRSGGHKVFIGQSDADARLAASLAVMLGYERVSVLDGGYGAFTRTILDAPSATGRATELALFRASAGVKIAALIKTRGAAKPVARPARKILGGCGV